VIQFLLSEAVINSEIYRKMTIQYGNNCMSLSKVYEWVERIKGGWLRTV